MDNAARSAFVVAQSVCAMAEVAALQAENVAALARGEPQPNGAEKFRNIEYTYLIRHTAVIDYLRG